MRYALGDGSTFEPAALGFALPDGTVEEIPEAWMWDPVDGWVQVYSAGPDFPSSGLEKVGTYQLVNINTWETVPGWAARAEYPETELVEEGVLVPAGVRYMWTYVAAFTSGYSFATQGFRLLAGDTALGEALENYLRQRVASGIRVAPEDELVVFQAQAGMSQYSTIAAAPETFFLIVPIREAGGVFSSETQTLGVANEWVELDRWVQDPDLPDGQIVGNGLAVAAGATVEYSLRVTFVSVSGTQRARILADGVELAVGDVDPGGAVHLLGRFTAGPDGATLTAEAWSSSTFSTRDDVLPGAGVTYLHVVVPDG